MVRSVTLEAKEFATFEAAVRYAEGTFLQHLPNDGVTQPCRVHQRNLAGWKSGDPVPVAEYFCEGCKVMVSEHHVFGCNVTGGVHCLHSRQAFMDWMNKLAFGMPASTDKLWPNGVNPETGRG